MTDEPDPPSQVEAAEPAPGPSSTDLGGTKGRGTGPLNRRDLLSAAAGALAGGTAATLTDRVEDHAVNAHLEHAVGAHPATAISIEPSGELAETSVAGALGALDARLAGLLQFSPDFLQDYALLVDEFVGGSTISGQIGSLGWGAHVDHGGSLSAEPPPLQSGPGWCHLRTGTTAPNGVCALRLDEVGLRGHPLFVWEVRLLMPTLNDGSDTVTWRAGLHDGGTASDPTTGIFFEYRADSTTLRCRTTADGVGTDADSEVAITPDTPFRLRITSDGGGVVYFSVDDDVVSTITSDLPADRRSPYGPSISIERTAGSGAERLISVDYFYLLWAVAR